MKLITILQVKDSLSLAISEKVSELSSMSGSELLNKIWGDLTQLGMKIIAAILIYVIGAWLIRWVRRFLIKVFNKRSLEPSLSGFVISFVNITLTVLLFVIVVTTLGVPTSTFTALLAAGGLAIGMALSGTLQNFAGGVMILLFKPFKVGDIIDTGSYSGTVNSIRITNTHLSTFDNKLVILPNGELSSNSIMNFSITDTRRAEWSISIPYGSDVDKTKELLLGLLNKDQRVLKEPAEPFVALSELGKGSIVIMLRAWSSTSDFWQLYYDINEAIYKELPKNGIEFFSPKMDVVVKNEQGQRK